MSRHIIADRCVHQRTGLTLSYDAVPAAAAQPWQLSAAHQTWFCCHLCWAVPAQMISCIVPVCLLLSSDVVRCQQVEAQSEITRVLSGWESL